MEIRNESMKISILLFYVNSNVMRQIAILLLLPLMLTGCSSDDDSSNSNLTTGYYTINRNGQSLRQDIDVYSALERENCSDPDFRLKITYSAQYIETSEFGFSLGMVAPTLKLDIDNNLDVPINTDIINFSNGECILLYQFDSGYYEENYSVTLDDTADNINTIAEISMITDEATRATYAIRGNYNLTYSDGEDYSVNISGEYVFHVDTLK
jgi:hypothetical protein